MTEDNRIRTLTASRAAEHAQLEALVLRAVDGDRGALEHAFAIVHGIARRYCAKRIDNHPALRDDAIQEVCLAVLRALPRYERTTSGPFAWLVIGIAAHKVADAYRAMARDRQRQDLVPDIRDVLWDGLSPEQVVLAAESEGYFRQLMLVLNDKERETIALLLDEDMSPKRVADRLGATSGAVRITRHRAIAKMRAAIGVAA